MPVHRATMTIPKVDESNGVIYSVQGLADLANQVEGPRAPRIIPEHDSHYFPIGKVVQASIHERDNDVVLTLTTDDTHSSRYFDHRSTDTQMVEVNFTNDKRPFVVHQHEDESSTVDVKVDRANFRGWDEYGDFVSEVENPNSHADRAGLLIRRSLTPEPWIQFFINNPELGVVLTWLAWRGERFLRYTIDETLRKAGDSISDALSEKIRRVIKVYENKRTDDTRQVTSHLVIKAEPQVNLLTRSDDPELNSEIGLRSLCEQMEKCKDLLESADSVTFARSSKDEEWKLLYIETSSGNVIVTADCYEKTLDAYDRLTNRVAAHLYLRHKVDGTEGHYKTFATLKKIDESGHFQMKFEPIPDDIEEWDLVNISLETD